MSKKFEIGETVLVDNGLEINKAKIVGTHICLIHNNLIYEYTMLQTGAKIWYADDEAVWDKDAVEI